MAKSQNDSSFRAGLFKFSLYKRNQGRLVRQLTAVAASILIFFGTYTLSKGPLSSYANSYLTMTARYVGGEADAGRDTKLQSLAEAHNGTLAVVTDGRRFQEREFHFSTSRNFSTDQGLLDEMKVSAAGFASDIESQYGAGVRVSQPRGQSRRAVGISIGIPVLLCAIGLWLVFRAVNFPRFADFLISVEAEMDKVSWPGRPELYRSTAVVVSTMFLLGFMLLAYDVFWKFFFELVGFLRIASS